MEISLGSYGSMMFDIMAGDMEGVEIEHWESIRAEAEPLVRQLLALNEKMSRESGIEPYKIIGVLEKKTGKKVLSKQERINKARKQLWEVKLEDLKAGDLIWFEGGDLEHYVGEYEPREVDFIKNGAAYIDLERQGVMKIVPGETWITIYRAPADYKERETITQKNVINHHQNLYESQEYWLEQADKLGI